MKTYDYMLEDLPPRATKTEIEEILFKLGADGWELVCVEYGFFIFKKEDDDGY